MWWRQKGNINTNSPTLRHTWLETYVGPKLLIFKSQINNSNHIFVGSISQNWKEKFLTKTNINTPDFTNNKQNLGTGCHKHHFNPSCLNCLEGQKRNLQKKGQIFIMGEVTHIPYMKFTSLS